MTPTHHLDDSTLLGYAAGTLNEAFTVVAASHIAVCPACRAAVRRAESVGGAFLERMEDTPVSGDCRARTMAALDRAVLPRRPVAALHSELPLPLASRLSAKRFTDLPWKKKAPGVTMLDVKLSGSAEGKLTLMRIGAGRAMPEHGHGGEEITLVLKGAYSDHLGRYGEGDVADLDESIEHRPVVDQDRECICLVATEQPTRFKSFVARLMQPFVGI